MAEHNSNGRPGYPINNGIDIIQPTNLDLFGITAIAPTNDDATINILKYRIISIEKETCLRMNANTIVEIWLVVP